MSKRQADLDATSPPTDRDRDSRPDDQADEGTADERMAVQRREEAQIGDAAAASPLSASAEPAATATQTAAAASTVAPFDRLALVELQLIMRCCDQSTLIALARCNKFALMAASSPFVWQPLSPIDLQCDWPLQMSDRLRPENSLLRHADVNVTWRPRTKTAASADQVAALAALPRLRGLAVESSFDAAHNKPIDLSDEGAVRLFQALALQIDHGGALTSLTLNSCGLRQTGGLALAAFVERSRTLTTIKITHLASSSAARDTLAPVTAALAHCRTLTCLEVSAQSFGSFDVHTLPTVIQQSPSLATFKLRGLRCEAESAATLVAAVAYSRSLTDLQLRDCRIDVEALFAAVEQSSGRIRRLDVSSNPIDSAAAVALARLLASDRCALTSLDISGNEIGSAGALALAGALQTNRTLTELRLGCIYVDREATAAVVSALQHNPHCRLRVLILSGSSIGQPAAASLAEALQRSGTLERLEVNGCSLTDETMATLAVGIGRSHSLQHLDVSGNKLGAAGAASLAVAICACPALTWLNVSRNEIGDEGLVALAPALLSVRTLKLNGCALSWRSAAPLAALIGDSRALESLHADSNSFGSRGVAELAAALQPSSSLRVLSLQYGCGVGVDGAAALAAALRRGWHASELHLDSTHSVNDICAFAWATALERLGGRCPLTALTLSFYRLTTADAQALVRAAKSAPNLRSLVLKSRMGHEHADRPSLVAECGPQPQFELRLP